MNRYYLLFFILSSFYSCKKRLSQAIELNGSIDTLSYYNQLLIKNPNLDSIYYLKGIFLIKNSNIDSGVITLEKAIKLNRQKPEYYYSLSDAYLLAIESKKAEAILDSALIVFPDHVPSLLKSARVKLILKKYMNALAVIDRIFQIDPENVEANYLAGHIFYEQEDVGRAVKCYQKTVDLDPEHTAAWIQLGDLMTNLKKPIAIQYYNNAIRLDSNNIETMHNRAYALQIFDKKLEAINEYKLNIHRRPDFELSYYNLGIIYQEIDSFSLSINYLNKAIELNNQEPSSYYHRAICKLKLSDKIGAKTDLQKSIELYPEYKEAIDLLKSIH